MANQVTVSDNINTVAAPAAPGSGVYVQLVNASTGDYYVSGAATDANADFSVTGVPPGVYEVFTGASATGPWTETPNQAYVVSDLVGGLRVFQGSGAPPNTVNGAEPQGGDIWLRTDTPSTANQRVYICTTGGSSPVWSGIL
ncbi:MAG: peptidase associated/transthyretin-like domain-containing protein [Candidatus Dormibacteria bacterium]